MFLDVTTSIYLYLISYIITIAFCLIYWEYSKKYSRRSKIISFFILFVTAFPYALLCANRSEYTGYDTRANMIGYFDMEYGIGGIISGGFDYFYQIVRYLTYITLGDNVKIWLFIIAFIPILFINYVLRKYARNKIEYAFGCLLFLLYLSPVMMDQSRQFIAIGMAMLAFYYLQQNNIKYFIIWVLIATLFHESCLTMFVFILLKKKIYSSRRFSIILPFLIVVISMFFIQYFMSLIYMLLPVKYTYIQEQSKDNIETLGMGWLVDVMPMMFVMFVYYKFRKKVNLNNLPLEACALSALPLRLAGYSSFFIMRLSYYGEVVCIILLLDVLAQMPKSKAVFWIFACFLIFFLHWYIDFVVLELNAAIPYSYNL